MIELDDGNSTESGSLSNQTSSTCDNAGEDEQKKDDVNCSLLSQSKLEFYSNDEILDDIIKIDNYLANRDEDNAEYKFYDPNMFLLTSGSPPEYSNLDDTDEFANFDPDNAFIFKNIFLSGQSKNCEQSSTDNTQKGNYDDMDEFDCQDNQDYDKSIAEHHAMNIDPDLCLQQLHQDDKAKVLENEYEFLERFEEYYTGSKKIVESQNAAWRLGPAKLWFDLLGVPESGEGFDYGFELAGEIGKDRLVLFDNVKEDAFLMVSQVHWEDRVIWDNDDTIEEQKLSDTSSVDCTLKPTANDHILNEDRQQILESQDGTWYSNFPVENQELVHGLWEDEIIWDPKAMKRIPKPKILELDPNDENIIFAIPDDSDPLYNNDEPESEKDSITHTKNITSLLSKTGVVVASEDQESESSTLERFNIDPFNISNDIYYMPKSGDRGFKPETDFKKYMPHSIPVLKLQAPFVPTYMGPKSLRNFHRCPIKRYARGKLAEPGPHGVLPLAKYISKKAKQRMQEQEVGKMFFMCSPEDLSGRDGDLVLIEFSEEHPPLMNFVGMCTKMKNYYKRKTGKDTGPPTYKYGEAAYPQSDLFLGNLAPGQSLQALENNLYRAPIYEHEVSETDFLVIRTRDHYYIREVNSLYVAGQQCPLYEVPAPNSKKLLDFMKNLLYVFVYRMFRKSENIPPRIHKDVLSKNFPNLNGHFLKKHLDLFADYHKSGPDCNYWVLKPSFRLPTEDEIRSLVSPEQCCAYFSMMAGQQRLKDAGYGEKSAFSLHDDKFDHEELQSRLDDEVKAAPWNTTHAYIEAMSGKCYLQLTGPADPTGCGEGFSYVRVPYKSVLKQVKKENPELISKINIAADANLNRLSANSAQKILRDHGVTTQHLKKLTGWEMVDAVRTLATIKETSGNASLAKFIRGNRLTMASYQKIYKQECQRIFDLQNQVLSSREVQSSDDEDENLTEVNEEVKEMAENIENLLMSSVKSARLAEFEREEREREELMKMLAEEDAPIKEKPVEKKNDESSSSHFDPNTPRILKISRTFRNADGTTYMRTEIVRNLTVVDVYLKIRSTKDAAFIKQYANADEVVERENKQIQAQLKNLKNRDRRKEKSAETSKTCTKDIILQKQLGVNEQELVKAKRTKLKSSMKLIKQAEGTRQTTLPLNVLEKTEPPKKRRRSGVNNDHQSTDTNRRRTNPLVLLSTIFEEILSVLRARTEFRPFLFPVNTKSMPNYRRIVGRPMDLQTIRENLHQQKYQSRKQFLADVIQIKENSVSYNGPTNPLTDSAQKMLNQCVELLAKREDEIIRLEKAINPLINDEDQDTFSQIIGSVIQKIKKMPEAIPFLKPVNKNLVVSKDYYNTVKNPMDIETICKKIASHKYRNRTEVVQDFQLIYNNCVLFNGQNSLMKKKAEILLNAVKNYFEDLAEHVLHLESSIASVRDLAMRHADIDTSWMYKDMENDDRVIVESENGAEFSLNLSEDESEESSMDTDCIETNVQSTILPLIKGSPAGLSENESEESDMDDDQIEKNHRLAIKPPKPDLLEDLQCSSDDDL